MALLGKDPTHDQYPPDPDALEIQGKWNLWDTQRSGWKNAVSELRQYVYATDTRTTTNNKNDHVHSTHIPKLAHLFDGLLANYAAALFLNKQFFGFVPADSSEAAVSKKRALESYLRTKHEYNGFQKTALALLVDILLTGNCFVDTVWVHETKPGGALETQIPTYVGPKPVRINPLDIVFNPLAERFENSPKIIRRTMDRTALGRYILEATDDTWNSDAVAACLEFARAVKGLDPSERQKVQGVPTDGFGSIDNYFSSGVVTLLEFRGDWYNCETGEVELDQIITVADGRFVVRRGKIKDITGGGSIFKGGWRDRPDNLWSQGPLDNLVGMQYLVNHWENSQADALDNMVLPDRAFTGQYEVVEREDGGKDYIFAEAAGSVNNLAPPSEALTTSSRIAEKLQLMDLFAGLPMESIGFRTPGEKTAFEVESLSNGASRLFQAKLSKFDNEIIEPLLNKEIELAVTNLNDATDTVSVYNDKLGIQEFLTITKNDLVTKGAVKALGARFYAKRSKALQELQQINALISQDQSLGAHFPAKERARLLNMYMDYDNVTLFKEFGAIAEQAEAQQEASNFQAASAASNAVEPPPDVLLS